MSQNCFISFENNIKNIVIGLLQAIVVLKSKDKSQLTIKQIFLF